MGDHRDCFAAGVYDEFHVTASQLYGISALQSERGNECATVTVFSEIYVKIRQNLLIFSDLKCIMLN